MSQKVLEQIKKLSNLEYTLDNGSIDLDQYFSEITFKKRNADKQAVDSIRVVFEDYIIKPFDGFDLHEKWNNGVAPYSKIMYGKIIKETAGMYMFTLHSEFSDKTWTGWCPKKSCEIRYL